MPTAKLTKTVIDSFPYTESGQLLIWDSELRGFGVCIGQRSKTFFVQRDINRRSVRLKIGRYGVYTVDIARKEAQQILYTMEKGIDPVAEKKRAKLKKITLEELLDSFFKARTKLRPHTRKNYQYSLNKYLSDWMKKPVSAITEDMFFTRYFEIGERCGPTAANNVRRILSSVLTFGKAVHKAIPNNPVKIIAESKTAYPTRRRRTYIKPYQLTDFWAATKEEGDTTGDYLRLLLLTGMRRSEGLRLRWRDIDFKDRTLTLPETKNGEPLILPLSNYLQSMLSDRHKVYGHSEWVFPGTGEEGHLIDPKKAVARVVKKSGIKFTLHDLRRTFITIAEGLDISTYTLKRLINHKIANDITGGYIIVDVERLRAPVERISQTILEVVKNGTYTQE